MVLIVLRPKNATPKRFFKSTQALTARTTHRQSQTERDIETEKRHSTHIRCGPAGGKVFGIKKGEEAEERGV